MNSRIRLSIILLGFILGLHLITETMAANFNLSYKIGHTFQYTMSGVFQVEITNIEISNDTIEVTSLADSNMEFGPYEHISSWTTSTNISTVQATWEGIDECNLLINIAKLLKGYVIFPDLGEPYNLSAFDDDAWDYYSISINEHGILVYAQLSLNGGDYYIYLEKESISGFSAYLILISTIITTLGILYTIKKRINPYIY